MPRKLVNIVLQNKLSLKHKLIPQRSNYTYTTPLNSLQIFKGNADEDSKVTNKLSCPIWARCVRVVPKTWNNHIAMRLEFLGCPIKMPGAPTSKKIVGKGIQPYVLILTLC